MHHTNAYYAKYRSMTGLTQNMLHSVTRFDAKKYPSSTARPRWNVPCSWLLYQCEECEDQWQLDGHYDGGVPRPCHVAAASSKQLLDEELLPSDMKIN